MGCQVDEYVNGIQSKFYRYIGIGQVVDTMRPLLADAFWVVRRPTQNASDCRVSLTSAPVLIIHSRFFLI